MRHCGRFGSIGNLACAESATLIRAASAPRRNPASAPSNNEPERSRGKTGTFKKFRFLLKRNG
jgi:hypothetical protein